MILPRNKTLRVAGGACVAIVLAEAAMLVIGTFRLATANRALRTAQQSLGRLQRRNPYPSEANVRTLEKNLDELDYRMGALEAELFRDPFLQDSIEAAEFSARAQDTIERFRNQATHAGIQLPDTFEAGFARYASGGALPQPAQVPRLSRQLDSVERVADVLVQCGVTSVDAIARVMFEEQDEPGFTRRRSRSTSDSGERPKSPSVATLFGPEGIGSMEPVSVSFTASEEVVWRVLDRFAASPRFMVVSGFSHQNRTEILAFDPDSVKRGDAGDATARYLSEGILSGENALSRPERIVAGGELIAVDLMVDVYNFDAGGQHP